MTIAVSPTRHSEISFTCASWGAADVGAAYRFDASRHPAWAFHRCRVGGHGSCCPGPHGGVAAYQRRRRLGNYARHRGSFSASF